jgi:hypothetical protein
VRPADLSDTDPSVSAILLTAQRRLSPEEKVREVFALTNFLLRLSEAGVRRLHPDADDREVFLRAAARRLGRETVARVYGWDPGTP